MCLVIDDLSIFRTSSDHLPCREMMISCRHSWDAAAAAAVADWYSADRRDRHSVRLPDEVSADRPDGGARSLRGAAAVGVGKILNPLRLRKSSPRRRRRRIWTGEWRHTNYAVAVSVLSRNATGSFHGRCRRCPGTANVESRFCAAPVFFFFVFLLLLLLLLPFLLLLLLFLTYNRGHAYGWPDDRQLNWCWIARLFVLLTYLHFSGAFQAIILGSR